MTAQVHDHPARGRIEPSMMPFNTEAEQGLLGAILCSPATIEKVSDFLKADHFYMPAHQRIYAAIETLAAQGRFADPTILKTMFDADDDLQHLGGSDYLADLASSVVTVLNAVDYAHTIIDLHLRRQLICMADETKAAAANVELALPGHKVLEEAEAKLYELAKPSQSGRGVSSLSAALTDAINLIDEAQRTPEGSVSGTPMGIDALDKMLGGLHRGELYIVGARPAMGKTAFGLTISLNAARFGRPTLFFSLEMPRAQLAMRFISRQTAIAPRMLRQRLDRETFVRALTSSRDLANVPVSIDDSSSLTTAQIHTRARRWVQRQKGRLIVIDYLGFIKAADSRANRVHQIEQITGDLKAMAKDLDIPVVLLCQLNRALESRDEKRPTLADLRDSGSIEQDADVVMFIHREAYYLGREEPRKKTGETNDGFAGRMADWRQQMSDISHEAEVIVAKFRQGETGIVHLKFDGDRQQFHG